MVYTSHVPEHFYNLQVQITGEVAEECKDGSVVLSRKAAASPQALPQYKARILDTAGISAVKCSCVQVWAPQQCPQTLLLLDEQITQAMKLYYQ